MTQIRSIIQRCTITSALLTGGMLILSLSLLLWQRHYPIFTAAQLAAVQVPLVMRLLFQPLLWAALIIAVAVVSQVRKYRQVQEMQPLVPYPNERSAHLVQAIQEDLQSLCQSAGLKTTPQVILKHGERRLAYVAQYPSKDRPTSIFLSTDLINLRPSRQEVRGLLAHELGHRLLNTTIWRDQVMETVRAVSLILLLTPVLKVGLVVGDALCAHTSLIVGCCGAVLTILAGVAVTGLCFRLCEGILSRLHERACDDISKALVAPGVLASLLIKRERHLIKYGLRSHGPIGLSIKGMRNLISRLISSHPTLFERIKRNRRSLPKPTL